MINWKTTFFGIAAAAGLVLTQLAPSGSAIHKVGGVLSAVGVFGTGASAKDKDVTGTGANARRGAS